MTPPIKSMSLRIPSDLVDHAEGLVQKYQQTNIQAELGLRVTRSWVMNQAIRHGLEKLDQILQSKTESNNG